MTSSTPLDVDKRFIDELLDGANNAKLPPAPLQLVPLPAPYDLHLPPHGFCPWLPPVVEVPKTVTEYPLPGARQTHELAAVGDNMLLVTQQTNSTLVKVQLDPKTGRPISCARFLLGDFWAGLHGLAASTVHLGQVWATMQFKSILIRINVGSNQASTPIVEQVIDIPTPAFGPHCVYEHGTDLWTSCKDSGHVVRINQDDPSDFSVYPCSPRPIFIAVHPTSGDVYASLILSNKIWHLDPDRGTTTEHEIDATKGNTPVGLVAGTDGNVWFTLLGGACGGTGTFVSISKEAKFEYFTLTTPIGVTAGLVHLAFDWDYHLKQDKTKDGDSDYCDNPNQNNTKDGDCGYSRYIRLWLLSSTMAAMYGSSIDAVFSVEIDSKLSRITTQHSIALPTQPCATHRILPHRTGLFVSQLAISSLAHIAGSAALTPGDVVGETTDMYSDFGLGESLSHYIFSESNASRGALYPPMGHGVTIDDPPLVSSVTEGPPLGSGATSGQARPPVLKLSDGINNARSPHGSRGYSY